MTSLEEKAFKTGQIASQRHAQSQIAESLKIGVEQGEGTGSEKLSGEDYTARVEGFKSYDC